MNLRFLTYTSILSLMTALSTPVMGMESEEPPHSPVTLKVAESGWSQALFTRKYSLLEPTLDLERLQKEILAVFMVSRNSPKSPETSLRISRVQGLLDRESQKHSEEEDLQSFLFRLYSGRIMKNSPFHNQGKAVETLDKACQQEWGWAFWERALLQSLPAGQLTRDHYLAANRGHKEAVAYVQKYTSYMKQVAETFLQALKKEKKEKRRNEKVKDFEALWKSTGYARPFTDVVEFLQKTRAPTLDHLMLHFAKVAADLGDVNQQAAVAESFIHLEDEDAALVYTKKAAQNGHKESLYNWGLELQKRGDREGAIASYIKAANLGDPQAMANLGVFFDQNGNLEEAIAWSRKAAGLGNLMAMHNLGVFLDKQGDLEGAIACSKKAVERGCEEAKYNMGLFLDKKGNQDEAITWYEMVADRGFTNAQNDLGVLLLKKGDREKGISLLNKAASNGDPQPMYNLGVFFGQNGNLEEAIAWSKKAANRGHVVAMNNLGAYLEERGNLIEAEKWFKKAANRGHENSMIGLGNLYLKLNRTSEALFWLEKSASIGNEVAKEFLEIVKQFEKHETLNAESTPISTPEKAELDKKLDEVFEKLEKPEIKMMSASMESSNLKAHKEVETHSTSSSSDEEWEEEAVPEVEAYKKPEISNNPKTRREKARSLAQLKRHFEEEEKKPNRRLEKGAQATAKGILSGHSAAIEERHIKALFEDPYFLGQVIFERTKKGFKVLSYHRGLKKHLNAGTHHKHGKEKYVGHIHPKTLMDIKAILELFDVKE